MFLIIKEQVLKKHNIKVTQSMIKSMTAYADIEKTEKELTVSVEIRTYNSRYLDIVLRIPKEYGCIEERIKKLVSGGLSRGRIEIKLQIKYDSDNTYAFDIDTARAKALHESLMLLKDTLQISGDIPLDLLMNSGQIIKPSEIKRDVEADWDMINGCVAQAILAIDAMRRTEGDFIAKDLTDRIHAIKTCMDQIEAESSELVAQYQNKLKERLSLLTEDLAGFDQTRLAQEAAVLADKSDISEEIVRTRSHIEQFYEMMNDKEPAGRKLNFLLQEMNRECNTISSKSGSAAISHIIVNVKSELEKVREQLQNVE